MTLPFILFTPGWQRAAAARGGELLVREAGVQGDRAPARHPRVLHPQPPAGRPRTHGGQGGQDERERLRAPQLDRGQVRHQRHPGDSSAGQGSGWAIS